MATLIQRLRSALVRLGGARHGAERGERLDEEIGFHIEMQTQRNLEAGMSPEEARRQAMLAFGGRERFREEARDEYRSRPLEELAQDVGYAGRTLRRSGPFAVAAMLTLALAIGANTAMFSVVNALLLRKLPYVEPERLVMLWERNLSSPTERNVVGPANFLAWRDAARSFEVMAAFVNWPMTVSGASEEPAAVTARLANAPLLGMLGARPLMGRLLTEGDDTPEAPRVAVISHALWMEQFGGRRDVVGRSFRMNAIDHMVIGVLPADFHFYEPVDLWVPMRFTAAHRTVPGRYIRVLARLKPGVTPEQADLEMKALARQRLEDVPEMNANWTALAVPLHENLVGGARPALLVLLGAVGFLLVIACANVANLLLARAADRQREIAIRVSLGAAPGRIVRQLLTESVVLAVAGAAAGLLLALWGTRALVALIPAEFPLPQIAGVAVDVRVLAFTAVLAVVTGIAFGLAPALQARGSDVHELLKEGGRSGASSSRARRRFRNVLVVAEMSLAFILLAGAGLMVKSFAELQQVRLGFEPRNVMVGGLSLPRSKYQNDTVRLAFFEEVERRVAAIPGVQTVGAISFLPLSGLRSASSFLVEGFPAPPPGEEPVGDMRAVTPGYFQAMGIAIKAGRPLLVTDGAESPSVAVVSETLARTFWPNESAIGKYLLYEWFESERVEIVGVAADVHHENPAAEPFMEIYRPLTQFPYAEMTLVVRGIGDQRRLAQSIREAVHSLDPEQPVAQLRPMEELVAESVGTTRLSTMLFGLFGGLGLVLAAVGIYGVMSYTVQQGKHEIGVRMALGASPATVLAGVMRSGLTLAIAGVAIGVAGALALTRLMRTLLFGVSPGDPMVLVQIALVLAVVAAVAVWVPARRATRVDPMLALRNE
ncbi:MAG TPA: ABC transporter permease [Gemmatimonadaceae bacterium]|nr:ABC transporter permease [Gemmatimonadaceae bacterium]